MVKQGKYWQLAYFKKYIQVTKMGRINVGISNELEKQLRLKTVERFGGKKGDLSKAVQDAVRTWINN
jgi:hypothetical protein